MKANVEKESTIHHQAQVGLESPESIRRLRIACRIIALALGAADAWATRFSMNPDGVSYLDIGDAYWRGDWHNAINAYWSPLYSWILGFFLKIVKPSAYWEYPVVHFVNFLIFAAALACFDFFLFSFVAQRQERHRDLQAVGEMGLSQGLWYLLGYAVFIWTSLVMVRLAVVSPDILVFMFICLDCALLVTIRLNSTKRNFVYLGIALGVGYLAKAVLFPLGFVFLIVAALSQKAYRQAVVSGVIFLVIAAPFIASISFVKHRLTFGESGRLTYAGYISNLEPWFPGDGGDFHVDHVDAHAENIDKPSLFSKELTHPVKQIFDKPASYFFDGPIGGTYPFWYDVSYWQDGVRPFFILSRQLLVIQYSTFALLVLVFGVFYQLTVTVVLLLLFVLAPRPSVCFATIAREWCLLLPVSSAILMYAMVHLEYRYIATFVCIGWIALFTGVRLPVSSGLRFVMRFVVLLAVFFQIALTASAVWGEASSPYLQEPVYSKAAEALREQGVVPGTKIAMISDEPWGEGGPFVARLARLQIVAQVNTPSQFWSAAPSTQSQVLHAFAATGAELVIALRPPQTATDWKRLAGTDYGIFKLSDEKVEIVNPGSASDSDLSQ